MSGRKRRRTGAEFAIWKLDLLRAAGLIEPVLVELPELPNEASTAARLLRERFAVLTGLRALRADGGGPAPYTKRFAADWCGLSESAALRALGELRAARVIVAVGSHPSRGSRRPATLYLPGRPHPRALPDGRQMADVDDPGHSDEIDIEAEFIRLYGLQLAAHGTYEERRHLVLECRRREAEQR